MAAECAGRPPRFPVDPLPTGETRPEVFKEWFRGFNEVRDVEGAERCLRTAIDLGISSREIADIVFAAATDRVYLDGGHVLDFCNKAFELLDHIGWEHAGQVLTSLVRGIATARRSEELNTWRNPIDLSSMVWEARGALPELWRQGVGSRGVWDGERTLVDTILADDPAATLEELGQAVRAGATAEQLGGAVAYAAFLRMARFHTSNEFGDWDTVHNTLTAANALHQALKRAPSVELLRAVFDTAMSIYLDRFLNMPSQRMPEPKGARSSDDLGARLLEAMDSQQQVEQAARIVTDYVTNLPSPEGLLSVLAHAMLREDSTFHHFQIVDAALKQYERRRGTDAGRHVLVGAVRFLAAHYPTPRAVNQTFSIAVRLQRGRRDLQREVAGCGGTVYRCCWIPFSLYWNLHRIAHPSAFVSRIPGPQVRRRDERRQVRQLDARVCGRLLLDSLCAGRPDPTPDTGSTALLLRRLKMGLGNSHGNRRNIGWCAHAGPSL